MTVQTEDHCCDIAIVGGGCSGALVAVQLMRHGFAGEIAIIEVRERLGHGLAYSSSFDHHLLNVPAAKMSALPDQPLHFLRWLRERHLPECAAEAFVARRLYGEYIEDVLHQATGSHATARVRHVRAEALDAAASERGLLLTLSDGSKLAASAVVLALGNPASGPFDRAAFANLDRHWQISPWQDDALRVRFADERILLVGTGLTAVDSALALHEGALPAKIYMVSRRGILPQVHDLRRKAGPAPAFDEPQNVRLMFQQLRAQIARLREEDNCWRAAVDSLRPVSNDLWEALPVGEQRRYLRHLKTYWETHRHRMAPEIRQRMDDLRAEGGVEIIAGRIAGSDLRDDVLEVTISLRAGGTRVIEIDRAINCTGIFENYRKSPRPLIARLIASGLASANELGLGFHTDHEGAMVNAQGEVSDRLFTLGPPRRGGLIETTAVPEIRAQAEALGKHLAMRAMRAAGN